MSRRRQSPFEDLIEIASMLPWQAAFGLALVSYLLLHHIASAPIPTVHGIQDAGRAGADTLWKTLAMFGQLLVPIAFIVGGAASILKRARLKAKISTVTASPATAGLTEMDWREFEELVAEAYRSNGYQAKVTTEGADGGVDVVLTRDGERFLVQCKHWKAFKVGVNVVRELYGVMAAEGAAGGFVVTSGQFTSEAAAFASGTNITLVDGPRLTGLLKSVGARTPASPASDTVANVPTTNTAPACPRCGAPMVRRTARRGPQAGNRFWGCSTFPACRGIR